MSEELKSSISNIIKINSPDAKMELIDTFRSAKEYADIKTVSSILPVVRRLNQITLVNSGFNSMNDYLNSNKIKVGKEYADLSSRVGYSISAENISDETRSSQDGVASMEKRFRIRHDPIYWLPARNGDQTDPLNLEMGRSWSEDPLSVCENIAQQCADLGVRRVQINHPDGDIPNTTDRQPNEYQRLKHRDPQRLNDILTGIQIIKEVADEVSIYTGPGYVPESQQKYMVPSYFVLDARDPKNVKKLCDQYLPWVDAGIDRIAPDNIASSSAGPAGPAILADAMMEYLKIPVYVEALPYNNLQWPDVNQELWLREDHQGNGRYNASELRQVMNSCKFNWIIFDTYVDRLFANQNGPSEIFTPRIEQELVDVFLEYWATAKAECTLLMQPPNTLTDANGNRVSIYNYYEDGNGNVVPIPEELQNPIMGPLGLMRENVQNDPAVRSMAAEFTEMGHTLMSNSWDFMELAVEMFNESKWAKEYR